MSELFIVPDNVQKCRIDKALALAFPEHSRTAWQRALDAGLVTRDEIALSRKNDVHAGEEIEFDLPEVTPTALIPADIPLDILFEDEHLLVVNKPAGMVVHPGAGTGGDTLVHALLGHCADSLSGIGGVERPGIVHRLDRETSGAIVVAKHDIAHRGLSAQFAERDLQKEYLAIANGVPQLLSGMVDQAISRHPNHRHRMTVGESNGKPARTDWRMVESFTNPLTTLFLCRIHSGRTHQIRVHLKSIGHSILGDRTYGWKPLEQPEIQPPRVMLHAFHLNFTHPVTKQLIEIEAPKPADFEALLDQLRKRENR
jgi:23S rRNA pseudouridine1911/1915/1917 synthase